METLNYTIREAWPNEYYDTGQLMVNVYSQLEGFPTPDQQPKYYAMLAHIGDFTRTSKTKLLIAITEAKKIIGAVVYFGDMKNYGSGGTATKETNASGFRLLAVDPINRGNGVGKKLIQKCISVAKEDRNSEMIIHSTESMKVAWEMYEKLGFKRSEDLDFIQENLPVYGFHLQLD